jgi:hypothetical protein
MRVKENGSFEEFGLRYVRPSDWLTLPTVNVGDQKVVGLIAVHAGGSNQVAINAAGAYTVNWGDGSSPENVATGVTIQHSMSYAGVSGTECSRGYRQAIVTITPQAGQNLTTIDLTIQGTGVYASTPSNWLDIKMAGANVATLKISSNAAVTARMLEQFEYVGPSNIVTGTSAFYNAALLKKIIGTEWTALIQTFTTMFVNCVALQNIPLFDTSSGINFTSMFNACLGLKNVPPLDTSSGTNFTSMFSGCYGLHTIPLLDLSSGITFTSMFQGCIALDNIPLFNTILGQTFTSMFSGCSTLTSVPLLNTGAGTVFTSMFLSCVSLKTVPLFNTSLGTTFTTMFSSCYQLEIVPLFNLGAGITFTNMFQSCYALRAIPLFNVANGTTGLDTMLSNCFSLQVGAMSGTKVNVTYTNCKLSSTELDAIYTNLASGVTAKTITVTNNWGVSGDTPSIATAKGWTVTGS